MIGIPFFPSIFSLPTFRFIVLPGFAAYLAIAVELTQNNKLVS